MTYIIARLHGVEIKIIQLVHFQCQVCDFMHYVITLQESCLVICLYFAVQKGRLGWKTLIFYTYFKIIRHLFYLFSSRVLHFLCTFVLWLRHACHVMHEVEHLCARVYFHSFKWLIVSLDKVFIPQLGSCAPLKPHRNCSLDLKPVDPH